MMADGTVGGPYHHYCKGVQGAVERLLDGEGEELTRKAIELAKEGDLTALRLCLERICPPRKSRPIAIDLPDASTP
jgi:hypothetical protein